MLPVSPEPQRPLPIEEVEVDQFKINQLNSLLARVSKRQSHNFGL